ncbi:hypothetical protein B0H14DRAFT_3489938 [Mycena olivaceomarginata]|nr:hypothetical protein B0H14DRAFT_3489938 [Mycena olivaceomarginata]
MPSFSTLPHSALLRLLLPASGAIRPIQGSHPPFKLRHIAPHCAAVAPGSPALGALLPYRAPTLVPPARPLLPASQLCIQLQLHPPARVCALCAARRRPTRLPVFAPSARPAAGLPVRRCLRPQPPRIHPLSPSALPAAPPLRRPPLAPAACSPAARSPLRHPSQAYPSAGVCALSPLVSTRSHPLCHPPLAHRPRLRPSRCPPPAVRSAAPVPVPADLPTRCPPPSWHLPLLFCTRVLSAPSYLTFTTHP